MNREQLLIEFLQLSQRISELDFTDLEHLAELKLHQDRQAEIRNQFDLLDREHVTPRLKAIAEEIKAIELVNMNNMQKYKTELEQTGLSIRTARRVKSIYESPHIQGFGYFVDSHK